MFTNQKRWITGFEHRGNIFHRVSTNCYFYIWITFFTFDYIYIWILHLHGYITWITKEPEVL